MHVFSDVHKLKKAGDFSSVFIFRKVKSGLYLKIHFKPNELNHSRLGLVVSKKVAKRANRRNYMKRLIRELFRQNQPSWKGFDLIVRVVQAFEHKDYKQVMQEFLDLTRQFNR